MVIDRVRAAIATAPAWSARWEIAPRGVAPAVVDAAIAQLVASGLVVASTRAKCWQRPGPVTP